MEREDNPWDEHAILLRDSQRRKCGYIPANENVIFARLMDAGKLLKAKVVEKDVREGKSRRPQIKHWYKIRVEVYLVDF
ncbi:HIRAN domain-containing protein [Faecalibaculum rodentium]|nr:HIRAN domain-containing protein [Faecalibaculum rodentium]